MTENNRKLLVEMATVCSRRMGFGFVGIIYSNEHNPPHMHIKDLDENDLGQILLTPEIPQDKDDIVEYKGDVSEVKRKIVGWANNKNERGVNNWIHSLSVWDTFQEDQIK
jgi:hypothetical protein